MNKIADFAELPFEQRCCWIAARCVEQHRFPQLDTPDTTMLTPQQMEQHWQTVFSNEYFRSLRGSLLSFGQPYRFFVDFEDGSDVVKQIKCVRHNRLHDFNPAAVRRLNNVVVGSSPYMEGDSFLLHLPELGSREETSWSSSIRWLHDASSYRIDPDNEVLMSAYRAVSGFIDAYAVAIDRELPGMVVAVDRSADMLHAGPDTPLGRALHLCLSSLDAADPQQAWLVPAVTSLWIAHGDTIEANCTIELDVDATEGMRP